ncbi:hypothetical protein D3C76_1516030 [compost metagenome]
MHLVADLQAALNVRAEAVPLVVIVQINEHFPDHPGGGINFHRVGGHYVFCSGHDCLLLCIQLMGLEVICSCSLKGWIVSSRVS